ncbi:MAG TPA: sortase [Candidatus Eisenbacteria bacterium]|nr:sortase [Candidatus Eisenbacteria bacterium]
MERRPTHPTKPKEVVQRPTPEPTTQPTSLAERPFPFWRIFILRSIGNFVVLFALFGISMTIGPALFYELRFQVDSITGVKYVVAEQIPSKLGKISSGNTQILTPPDTYFSIVIPRIGAASRVLINVDPNNETEYLQALQKGIAHAKGSVFPGMPGTSFYFAHSTDSFWNVGRYNAVFYLLKDMQVNDDIYLFFKNYRYNYKVTQTEILDANDVSLLVNAQKDKEEKIVLQTCWPPGTTWKRFIVVAKPIKS